MAAGFGRVGAGAAAWFFGFVAEVARGGATAAAAVGVGVGFGTGGAIAGGAIAGGAIAGGAAVAASEGPGGVGGAIRSADCVAAVCSTAPVVAAPFQWWMRRAASAKTSKPNAPTLPRTIAVRRRAAGRVGRRLGSESSVTAGAVVIGPAYGPGEIEIGISAAGTGESGGGTTSTGAGGDGGLASTLRAWAGSSMRIGEGTRGGGRAAGTGTGGGDGGFGDSGFGNGRVDTGRVNAIG